MTARLLTVHTQIKCMHSGPKGRGVGWGRGAACMCLALQCYCIKLYIFKPTIDGMGVGSKATLQLET